MMIHKNQLIQKLSVCRYNLSLNFMRRQRPAGSIYNASVSKQNRTPLSDKDVNTQRTVVKDKVNSAVTTFNHKWAYDLDNEESSKNSKQSTNSYTFESFNNSIESKPHNDHNFRFESFKDLPITLIEQINIQDSLAQYQKLDDLKENMIVKKLTCLNNIFKEIKELRGMDLTDIIEKSLSSVEDKLLAIEKQMIRDQTKKHQGK